MGKPCSEAGAAPCFVDDSGDSSDSSDNCENFSDVWRPAVVIAVASRPAALAGSY